MNAIVGLPRLVPSMPQNIKIDDICDIVSRQMGLSFEKRIQGKSRQTFPLLARQLIIFISCCRYPGMVEQSTLTHGALNARLADDLKMNQDAVCRAYNTAKKLYKNRDSTFMKWYRRIIGQLYAQQ